MNKKGDWNKEQMPQIKNNYRVYSKYINNYL